MFSSVSGPSWGCPSGANVMGLGVAQSIREHQRRAAKLAPKIVQRFHTARQFRVAQNAVDGGGNAARHIAVDVRRNRREGRGHRRRLGRWHQDRGHQHRWHWRRRHGGELEMLAGNIAQKTHEPLAVIRMHSQNQARRRIDQNRIRMRTFFIAKVQRPRGRTPVVEGRGRLSFGEGVITLRPPKRHIQTRALSAAVDRIAGRQFVGKPPRGMHLLAGSFVGHNSVKEAMLDGTSGLGDSSGLRDSRFPKEHGQCLAQSPSGRSRPAPLARPVWEPLKHPLRKSALERRGGPGFQPGREPPNPFRIRN